MQGSISDNVKVIYVAGAKDWQGHGLHGLCNAVHEAVHRRVLARVPDQGALARQAGGHEGSGQGETFLHHAPVSHAIYPRQQV